VQPIDDGAHPANLPKEPKGALSGSADNSCQEFPDKPAEFVVET
jgi:hypothetical protein